MYELLIIFLKVILITLGIGLFCYGIFYIKEGNLDFIDYVLLMFIFLWGLFAILFGALYK